MSGMLFENNLRGGKLNTISNEKLEMACDMLGDGASIRDTVEKVGIARETAHRIQKAICATYLADGEIFPKQKGGYWKQKRWMKYW